jgi:BirA family transcriptional regulator, biotin operon repressor / biotin---[acetyl-CoA-carboxylase] ligase
MRMETSLRIPTPWPGASVYLRETTVSTMDDALALARDGCPSGTVAAAGWQEKGRGRGRGTRWLSAPWESLLATVVLRAGDAGFPLPQLSLRAGLAVALCVEEAAGIAARIKWPNDVLWEGRKLAGVLCESRGGALLVGIGVNCTQSSFPAEIAGSAVSLAMAAGREVAPLALLPVVLARLKECLSDDDWRVKVAARLLSPCADGIVRGVDEDGALLVEAPDGRIVRRDR